MNQELNETLVDFVYNNASIFLTVQFVVSIVGIFMNIPHLFILSQSEMRISSTNSLLIGIAFCDFIFFSVTIYDQYWLLPFHHQSCINLNTYYYQLFLLLGDFLRETCEKASFWLGVFLAVTRLLIMKLPDNTKLLTEPRTGYLLVFLVLAVSSLLTSYYYSKWKIDKDSYSWKPGKECEGFPANYSQFLYYREFDNNYNPLVVVETHVLINGTSRILISVIYPVLAVFLIFEVRKSAKFAATVLTRRTTVERHRTARMILVMTIFYVIACAPGGASHLVLSFAKIQTDSILAALVAFGNISISALFCFNATSHGVINFTMSSKYRTTVKMVLGIRKKGIRVVSVTGAHY